MEADPNVTYKAAFRVLAEKLGRTPGPGDSEWLELHNNYSRSWAEAREYVQTTDHEYDSARRRFADGVNRGLVIPCAAGPVDMSPSREPAPQARAIPRESVTEPLSRPTINPPREEAESVPPAPFAAPGVSEGLHEGDRGPSGGLVSKCVACGGLWERPKVKGRPNYKCGGCR